MKKIFFILLIFLTISGITVAQPSASFSVDGNFCTGDTLAFINNSSGYTIAHWNFGDNTDTWIDNPQHIYDSAGTYTIVLTVFDSNGDSSSTNQSITINLTPTVTITRNNAEQSLTAHSDISGVAYQWMFNADTTNETDSLIYYLEDGTYTVVAITSDGCSASASETVSLQSGSTASEDTLQITVANNVLTPDVQDGANDILFIEGLANFQNPCSVAIYNSWGQLVYYNQDYSNLGGFEGTASDGKKLAAGTYYYIIKSEGRKTATGYIDLIR